MKKTFALLIIIFATLKLQCQVGVEERYTATTLGLKIGLNHSTFKYTDSNLKSLPHDIFINPNIGAFIELYISDNLFIAPELFLYNRGHLTHYVYEKNFNVTYKVRSRYFTTRVPIYYRFNISRDDNFKLFLTAAPSYNLLLGGKIDLYQPGIPVSKANINIGRANMRQQDFSIFFGCGGQFYINYRNFSVVTKIEFGYNLGLTNSFSDMEISELSKAENTNAYNITGERKINNIEFNVTIGIPLKFSHNDACWGIKRDKKSTINNKKYTSPQR